MSTDDQLSAFLHTAYEIIDSWEQTHSGRLLATRDAAALAEVIARALETAYARGRGQSGPPAT